MIKALLAGAMALALSGCMATLGQVGQAIMNPAIDEEMRIPTVNRAAIEAADLAAVMMISPSSNIATVGVAIQMREGRINYSSNDNRGVTLQGGLVYATLGLGTNLQAVRTQADDPLVTEAAVGAWPTEVTRTYVLSQRGTVYREIETRCTNVQGARAQIDVVGVMRDVVEVGEICKTAEGLRFANVHYLDVRSGRIWRTSQWTGPIQGNVQVDVIDQFDPDA